MLIWIWLGCLVCATVLYLRHIYGFFKRQGVKTLQSIPPFGTMTTVFTQREHFIENATKGYKQFPDERFIGAYQFTKPIVQVRDIELIKKIAVKDFEHFLDHNTFVNEQNDPLFGRNLVSLKGQEWKDMRSTLSPAFTSSKMKMMLPLMVEVGEQMIVSLKKKIAQSKHGYLDVDVKDLTTRYANDVIASCAFGLKVDSLKDEDNQFYIMAKTASTFKFYQLLISFLSVSFPKVSSIFKLSLFPKSVQNFFRKLVTQTMQNRELQKVFRPDMIHLLMEAKKGKLTNDEKSSQNMDAGFATVEESFVGKKQINRVWSDDDLCAQAVLFFIAGFETVSSAMSFVLYELAINPDVQERLYQEIKDNETKNGKFDYNSIQNMTYMDMVLSESLRLWTQGGVLDRYCTKDYNLGKPNDIATQDFIMRKGSAIQIPVWAIHHDPKYFPNPTKFDPERFSEENKHKIKPFTYMPFGLGPRNCIGSRFALSEVKVMLYQLLQAIELSPFNKTPTTKELDPRATSIILKGGHWIRFSNRKEL